MIDTATRLQPADLLPLIDAMWAASAVRIRSIEESWSSAAGAPVFTVRGKYTARGWTEWTQGFQFGSALLQFDATGDEEFLAIGRRGTSTTMPAHITHFGVHDHGFNIVSTHGNLRRLIAEGRIPASDAERETHDLALKCSGAVQAHRWTPVADGGGFVYSFNGPHSLFADTMRTLRAMAQAHRLGHALMGERDRRVSLLDRVIEHATATARYTVYYGEGRDAYDIRGRVAHESLFNTNDGSYRCPATQQGYSPFSTWTRGLAWVMLGFAELLEFLATVPDNEIEALGGRAGVVGMMERAAGAACDFYIANTPPDGVPYWDTGAPGLAHMGDYLDRPAEPRNAWEPVDASAAAIAAQGLLRFGRWLQQAGYPNAARMTQAGLTVARTILAPPYLCEDPDHQGLLLHTVYHRPNGWDHVPDGALVPCGEACMWGDYHLRELAIYLTRIARGGAYHTFWS